MIDRLARCLISICLMVKQIPLNFYATLYFVFSDINRSYIHTLEDKRQAFTWVMLITKLTKHERRAIFAEAWYDKHKYFFICRRRQIYVRHIIPLKISSPITNETRIYNKKEVTERTSKPAAAPLLIHDRLVDDCRLAARIITSTNSSNQIKTMTALKFMLAFMK